MFYRSCFIDRQAIIYPVLIFHGTTNSYMVIAISPVIRKTFMQPVDPFGNKQKIKIPSRPYHFPGFGTPFIRIFNQKIGSKAGINKVSRRNLIGLILFLLQRQIKLFRLCDDRTVFTIFTVGTINIAMPAPFTQFVTAVPGIPYRCFLAHPILFIP